MVDRVAAAAGAELSTVTDSLHVIDCQTDTLNSDTDGSVVTQNVDTPRNLTDIGIGFKDAFDEFERTDAERIRVGVLSLSVILTYVDRETVYRFCQTLTRAIQQDNAIGFFLLTATAHDEETINTLRRALDGAVEVRDGDDRLPVNQFGVGFEGGVELADVALPRVLLVVHRPHGENVHGIGLGVEEVVGLGDLRSG
ncbi:hypothetical protein BRD19_10430 [Halobacteriales archaeon SW_7_65_23]|nr:MAG: hypothetical protein BRD19_10430 [Halobacteriales archaeon SW_7_65_23]